uniref:Uncharacterized protein n=1 Tax=Alexandrium catenella TaxID=2925 RepID=A0A7S1MME2_ALECA|eukprot:CAMPEP_0171219592 /NCGR_PEP_ID=MMETSP0790-20130122/33797_1 /TAXON_ID=2925 /ORGANISM="Alexandrium catenella, Strain OF101" /LENGTH=135 /DNA_ID=CAMNT_0011685451 /DNA_START=67 /DNA_END=474 /DNA_ORIENTATION=+
MGIFSDPSKDNVCDARTGLLMLLAAPLGTSRREGDAARPQSSTGTSAASTSSRSTDVGEDDDDRWEDGDLEGCAWEDGAGLIFAFDEELEATAADVAAEEAEEAEEADLLPECQDSSPRSQRYKFRLTDIFFFDG